MVSCFLEEDLSPLSFYLRLLAEDLLGVCFIASLYVNNLYKLINYYVAIPTKGHSLERSLLSIVRPTPFFSSSPYFEFLLIEK